MSGPAPPDRAVLRGPTRQRLGEQVASSLLAAIRLHEYLPGQRLPPERELCQLLGVNRTAVREGLRWLEHQRYVEIRRGKYGGAFVIQPPAADSLERLRRGAHELGQLFEFRRAVEPATAALAAGRIEPGELDRLRALHAAETPDTSRDQRRALDVAFHEVIAGASRNELLFAAVREIRVRLAPGLDLIQGPWPARRAESRGGHDRLVAALAARDAEEAGRVMHGHVTATEVAIRQILAARGVDLGGP